VGRKQPLPPSSDEVLINENPASLFRLRRPPVLEEFEQPLLSMGFLGSVTGAPNPNVFDGSMHEMSYRRQQHGSGTREGDAQDVTSKEVLPGNNELAISPLPVNPCHPLFQGMSQDMNLCLQELALRNNRQPAQTFHTTIAQIYRLYISGNLLSLQNLMRIRDQGYCTPSRSSQSSSPLDVQPWSVLDPPYFRGVGFTPSDFFRRYVMPSLPRKTSVYQLLMFEALYVYVIRAVSVESHLALLHYTMNCRLFVLTKSRLAATITVPIPDLKRNEFFNVMNGALQHRQQLLRFFPTGPARQTPNPIRADYVSSESPTHKTTQCNGQPAEEPYRRDRRRRGGLPLVYRLHAAEDCEGTPRAAANDLQESQKWTDWDPTKGVDRLTLMIVGIESAGSWKLPVVDAMVPPKALPLQRPRDAPVASEADEGRSASADAVQDGPCYSLFGESKWLQDMFM
jgi:hypothetical protein